MSKTKILCIGDQHFKPSNIPQVNVFVKKLDEWLSQNPVDAIISMGDLLHTHERLHTQALNKAIEYVDIMSKYAPTYIQVGNHDFCNNSAYLTQNHWLNVFKNRNNITVVDDVTIVDIHSHKITLCPYVPDGKFRTALDTKIGEWEDSECIFAHQLFDGAKMGVIVAEDVEKWDENDPMIFCAHIHDKQWVQENIYIVGSAMQEAFGETEDKTLLLLTLTNDSDDILKAPVSQRDTCSNFLNKTFFEANPSLFNHVNLDLPKKRIMYLTMEELSEFDLETLKENIEYKLTVDGDQEEFDAFKKTTKYKSLTKKVKIVFKHKRSFLVEKRERHADDITSIKEKPKPFNKILKELVEQESNPYITNLFNVLVLQRSGEKEEMMFL